MQDNSWNAEIKPCRYTIHLLVYQIFSLGYTESERIEGPYKVIFLTHQFIAHRYYPEPDKPSVAWMLNENIFFVARQILIGQDVFFTESSLPHSDTPHSVKLLLTRVQPDAETATLQHTTLTRDRHPCPRQNLNPHLEPTERPQTHTLDFAASGIGWKYLLFRLNHVLCEPLY